MPRSKKIIKISAVSILAIILAIVFMVYASLSLSYQWKDKQNILLEGWVGAPTLEKLVLHIQEYPPDSIFLFGWELEQSDISALPAQKLPGEPEKASIKLIANSTLHVIPPGNMKKINSMHTITIKLKGDSANRHSAHYSLFVNEKFMQSGFAGSNPVEINLTSTDSVLHSISCTFDNDTRTTRGDRNLEIVSVKIDENRLTTENSSWFVHRSNFRQTGYYTTNAQFVKQYLHDLGIDTSIIQTYTTKLPASGNTLALAKRFHLEQELNEAFRNNQMYIFAEDTHALRSLTSFRRAAYRPENIGIYVYPPSENHTPADAFRYKLQEVFAIIFVFLFFYV